MAPITSATTTLALDELSQEKIAEIAIPLFLGYLIFWGLFGVLSTQVYLFYLAFPTEALSRCVLVYGVYLFELAQFIMLTTSGVETFGRDWGHPQALNVIGTIYISVPLMGSIVAFVVQAFYSYRIYVLAENLWAPILIIVCAAIGLIGGIATSIVEARAHLFSEFVGLDMSIATAIWNGGAAFCDAVIAGLMIYYLSKRRIGLWPSTQDRVSRIMRLIVETGSLTALVAIINLILSILPFHPTYYQITSCMLGKLYSNAMMVILNSRMEVGRLATMTTELVDIEFAKKRNSQYETDAQQDVLREDEVASGMGLQKESNRETVSNEGEIAEVLDVDIADYVSTR